MKYLLAVLLLVLPVCALAQTADALLAREKQDLQCTKPDRTLIHKETAQGTTWASETRGSSKYNRQVTGFNDCTRVFVDSANREITRIRDAARAKLDQIGVDATGAYPDHRAPDQRGHRRSQSRGLSGTDSAGQSDRGRRVSAAGVQTAGQRAGDPAAACA